MKLTNIIHKTELGNYRFKVTNRFTEPLTKKLMKPVYMIMISAMLLSFHGVAQTASVQSEILGKALEHPKVMPFHTLDETGMPKALYVASEQADVIKMVCVFRGFKTSITEADAFKNTNVKKYFLIKELHVDSGKASMRLRCHTDSNNYLDFEIHFQSAGQQWEISQFNEVRR